LRRGAGFDTIRTKRELLNHQGFDTTRHKTASHSTAGFRYDSPKDGESFNRRASPQPAGRKPDRCARKVSSWRGGCECALSCFTDMCIFAKLEASGPPGPYQQTNDARSAKAGPLHLLLGRALARRPTVSSDPDCLFPLRFREALAPQDLIRSRFGVTIQR